MENKPLDPYEGLGTDEMFEKVKASAQKRGADPITRQTFEEELRKMPENDSVTFGHYLKDLDLSTEELADKSILDVGSGGSGFERACKKKGVSQKVVSLDIAPMYVKIPNSSFVQADASEGLPFADGVFDFVLSHGSFYAFAHKRPNSEIGDKLITRLKDSLRVLKENGEVRIEPFFEGTEPDREEIDGMLSEFLNELRSSGKYEVEKTFVGDRVDIDENGEKFLRGKVYLLKIKKLKTPQKQEPLQTS